MNKSTQRIIIAASIILLSEAMIIAAGASIKAISANLPNAMTVFIRNIFGLLLLLPLIQHKGFSFLKTRHWHWHLLRASFGLSTMYCVFYAYEYLPLAQSTVLQMTTPFFFPLIAFLWFKEKLLPLAILAIPVGFIGVWLVVKPEQELHFAVFIALLAGLLAAISKSIIHVMSRTEPPLRIVFLFCVFAIVLSSIPAIINWQTPQGIEWLLLIQIAFCATCSQYLITKAYSMVTIMRIAPFSYSGVLFGAIYGYVFWGETVGWLFVCGAILITCSGVLAILAKPQKTFVADGPKVE